MSETQLREDMDYDWYSQACQYAEIGQPGIHLEQYREGGLGAGTIIDCLLARDLDGRLVGIFNHYNVGNLFQKPGSCNLWVRPDKQRQGVATCLLREADKLWELVDQDTYTVEGNAWIEGLVAQGRIDKGRNGSIEGSPDSISARNVPPVNSPERVQKG